MTPVSGDQAGRRLGVITIDQAVVGASNVLVSILAAHVLGVASFGWFGVVFIIYATAQGISRALVCDPLLVHPDEVNENPGAAVGSARALGIITGLVVLVAAAACWSWSAELAGSLAVLAACMPGLVVQDACRYLAIALHRPYRALVIDTIWLVATLVGLAAVVLTDRESLAWFVGVWAGSGAVVGMLAPWSYRGFSGRPSLAWIKTTWFYSWRYLLTFGATQGAALSTSIGIAAIAGAKDLGAVRGVLLLLRPAGLVQAAATAAGVAEISRTNGERPELRRHLARTTLVATIAGLGNIAVLLALPDAVGRAVLDTTWEVTEPLLLPAGIQAILMCVACGPRALLLGRRQVRTTTRIDVSSMAPIMVFMLIGASMGGALGAYWAVVTAQAIVAVVWWIAAARFLSGSDKPQVADGVDG